MAAIIFGVTAVAMLSALAFPDSGDALSKQDTESNQPSVQVIAAVSGPEPRMSPGPANAKSISPFELARSINDVRRKHVDVDLKETWQKFGIEAGQFETCSNDCEARVYRHELSGHRGPEVVIKLTRFFDFCRYLVFGQTADGRGWKFLGHVDHDFNRYEMARHRIAYVNGEPLLVIRGQEGSGSGYSLYAETWYDVSDNGVKPVLSYPSDGHTYPWPAGLGRSFSTATFADPTSPNHLIVQYAVDYRSDGYDEKVKIAFANRHRAAYKWDTQSAKFVFDSAASHISEVEINAIANIETEEQPKAGTKIGETTFYSSSEAKAFIGGGYEVFLKHNTARLLKIAKGPNTKAKAWLKQFLTECRDTDEKKALMAALSRN